MTEPVLHDPVAPDVIALDPRFGPLSALVTRLSGLPVEKLLVYLVDAVDAQLLPELGRQFHMTGLEGWRLANSDEARRSLIKRSIALHRKKGTPWAVQQVLETLALTGRISEWFQYGGQPYYFKVNVDLFTRGIDEATFDALVSLITEYKNVRSHLELLTLSLANRSQAPAMAAAALYGELATVYPYELTELNQVSQVPSFGIGHWSVETVWVYPRIA